MRWCSIALASVVCWASSTALAAERSYWVDWRAPPGCSSPARLNEQIITRSDGARSDPEGARYVVDVSQDAAGYVVARATLPSGSTRFVRALRCDEVAAAVAFIVSMDLEPQGDVRAPTAEPPEGPVSDTVEDVITSPVKHSSSEPASWRTYLGATGGVAGGQLPGIMPRGGLFIELADEAGPAWRRGKLSIVFGSGQLPRSEDDVSLKQLQALLEACPLGIGMASLCGGLEAGAVMLQGGDALANETTFRASVGARVGAQLRWAGSAGWLGELEGGALLPLTLNEYVVERSDDSIQSLHTVTLSGYAALSIGHRF